MAKIRTVEQYLNILKLAGKSPNTISTYRQILSTFAQHLDVPLTELHQHLTVDNLTSFAESRQDKSNNGRKSYLSVLHRYMTLCGVQFDELEYGVVQVQGVEDRTDKPLELATLQKMMDLSDTHGKAIISFLISTGLRAGEASQVLLTDIDGDVVKVRNEISKRKKGGVAFLTSEAREYLDLWLMERDEFIENANLRTKNLKAFAGRGKPRTHGVSRPANDQRLFACSYGSIDRKFKEAYVKVDGEKGKYRLANTAHSCRAYFRTVGVRGMSLDLVEGILRHSGYLNSAYVKMTLEEKREQFHAGEAALYITRADHRIQNGELTRLKEVNTALQERLNAVEKKQRQADDVDSLKNRVVESVKGIGSDVDVQLLERLMRKIFEENFKK
jgi:integrase